MFANYEILHDTLERRWFARSKSGRVVVIKESSNVMEGVRMHLLTKTARHGEMVALLDRLQGSGAQVVWLEPTPVDTRGLAPDTPGMRRQANLERFVAFTQAEGSRRGVKVVPLHALLREALTGGFRDLDEVDGAEQGDWGSFAWVSSGILLNASLITTVGFVASCALCYVLAVQGFRRSQGTAAAGATVSIVTDRVAPTRLVLPATSVQVAAKACAPSASAAVVKVHAPVGPALAVPRSVVPSEIAHRYRSLFADRLSAPA